MNAFTGGATVQAFVLTKVGAPTPGVTVQMRPVLGRFGDKDAQVRKRYLIARMQTHGTENAHAGILGHGTFGQVKSTDTVVLGIAQDGLAFDVVVGGFPTLVLVLHNLWIGRRQVLDLDGRHPEEGHNENNGITCGDKDTGGSCHGGGGGGIIGSKKKKLLFVVVPVVCG